MIIILDRYIVEIIDSSKYSKLHLSIKIARDTRDLLQVERKHDIRDLYYNRHLYILVHIY